jgi:uncharacterized membrane protein
MLGAAGVFGVIAGMAGSFLASWLPARAEAVQTAAGIVLLGGFALVGWAMPVMM